MPKKKIGKPQREMTHRQLTHWQKENRLQRIVFFAGIGIIAAILVILGVGFYMAKYRPLHEVVLKIGNTEYNMDYLVDTLASYNVKEVNPSQQQTYANIAVQSIEQNFFMTEAASKLDPPITVNDDNITKYIKDNSLPNDKVTQDSVRRQLISEKLRTDFFSPQIPVTAEHRAVWAMQVGGPSDVEKVKARLANGENFTSLAAELSVDQGTKDKKGDLGWVTKGTLSTALSKGSVTNLENKIFSPDTVLNNLVTFEDNTTQNPGYWLLKVTETKEAETQAHIYGILLGNETEAKDIGIKLATGGDGNDWDSLAKANSQYTDAATNGGDLGFVAKGTLGEAIDAAVFGSDGKVTLALNNVIGPLEDTNQTTNGPVWLIQVHDIDQNREISQTDRNTLIDAKANEWFQIYWLTNKDRITDSFNPTLQQLAIAEAIKR